MYRPLYWPTTGASPTVDFSRSLASPPKFANSNKTITIKLDKGYKWSNGKPVTAQDVIFTIDLSKAAVKENPANLSGYTPGEFPDNIQSATATDPQTVVLQIDQTYNSSWLLANELATSIEPLPSSDWNIATAGGPHMDFTNPANAKKIYDFLFKQSSTLGTYTTNPLWQVVDGPYKVSQYNTTTGAFTLVPNKTYGGPHVTPMSNFQGVPFTSDAAYFNAVKAKSIDVARVASTYVPQLPQVQRLGYNMFGEPDFGMEFLNYNFEDKTNHFNSIVSNLYFRQAMAHLEDEKGWISAFMHGAGAEAYGPIPAFPKSPFLPANAATNPYPFSVSSAVNLLKSHGWTVNAGGTDVCKNAGSGANQCGAGIPAGTQLKFNLIYASDSTLITSEMTDLASKAKQAGINITLQGSNFNYMISNYLDPYAPANANKWAMEDFGGESNNTYPTTFGLFNTGGSNQVGNYSNPQADKLINASISGSDPAAVKAEAAFLTTDQPTLFEPNNDRVWVWKNTLSATKPEAWESLTQYYADPEFWYFNS